VISNYQVPCERVQIPNGVKAERPSGFKFWEIHKVWLESKCTQCLRLIIATKRVTNPSTTYLHFGPQLEWWNTDQACCLWKSAQGVGLMLYF